MNSERLTVREIFKVFQNKKSKEKVFFEEDLITT